MLTTGVTAVLGFVFWLICARLFTPDEIGIGTSLISAMSLISYMSLLGFNNTFMRILPTSHNRSNVINTGLLLVITAAVVIAIWYIIGVELIAPKLKQVLDTSWYEIGFVVLAALAAVNLLTDSIFIAFRGAKYNLLIDGGIQGVVKLLLPLAFLRLGPFGVFMASGTAAAAAMAASIIFLIAKFDYRPKFHIHVQTFRNVFHYSSINYIANIFNIAPILILPLIVLNHLGAAHAGYYFMAFTVANLLYAVVYAVSSSLFAEGSYGDEALQKLFKRAVRIVAIIIIPCGLALALFGPVMLRLFGRSYSEEASSVLVLLALASPAVAAYTLGNVLLRITHRLHSTIMVNLIYMVTISGLALLWVDRGLFWIGAAWTAGNIVAAAAAFISVFSSRRSLYYVKSTISS